MATTSAQNVTLAAWLQVIFLCAAFFVSPSSNAAKAQLPDESEVSPGRRLAIDGLYQVSGINKRIRIDRGRAVVVEGWKHFFIWDVEPGMVTIRNIAKSQNNTYTGRDLPLQGDWRATYDENTFTLKVVVNGILGESRYDLTRVPDDSDTHDEVEEDYVEEQPVVVTRVAAIRVGNAKMLGCPGKQSYLSLGSCWSCPNDYRRASPTRAMDSPRACIKRGTLISGKHKRAKRKARPGRCPRGQFHVPEKGTNGCYRCPTGTKRIHIAGIDSLQCRT